MSPLQEFIVLVPGIVLADLIVILLKRRFKALQ